MNISQETKSKLPALAAAKLLTPAQFGSLRVTNGYGIEGALLADAANGEFQLSATLSGETPDSSDDDDRSVFMLSVQLEDAEGGVVASMVDHSYTYSGSSPGDHLRVLLREGTLLSMLFSR